MQGEASFVFRAAVNASMQAAGEPSWFARPGKQNERSTRGPRDKRDRLHCDWRDGLGAIAPSEVGRQG
jgi:hypothetical protein